MCALSGYETADPVDVLDPASAKKLAQWDAREAGLARGPRPAGRLAAIETLLRRVSSPDYLEVPERLDITRAMQADALALVELRNAVVHFTGQGGGVEPGGLKGPVEAVCRILQHLLGDAPAFSAAPHAAILGVITRDIDEVRTVNAARR